MSVIVLFALVGLFVAGVRGLLIGAALGYGASWALQNALGKKLALLRAQFLESTFAVMGALAKADGTVSREEIRVAESMFARLNLSSGQRESAMAAFDRGKAPSFDLDAEVSSFMRVARGHRSILVMFLQIQCAAVASDGNVHPNEHQMLVRVARGLGLSETDVAQLEALLRTGAPAASPQHNLQDAYTALGVSSSATDAEIKQAYRRLMSQNHPDKLAGRGLPESMREMAEQRSREISTAYAVVKEARGFV
ncbi:MAG: co-chaperone DjlA [Pseudomonadota bacterium]|nr:co-chaperone DjlA [Pseudomonadota bacterium]